MTGRVIAARTPTVGVPRSESCNLGEAGGDGSDAPTSNERAGVVHMQWCLGSRQTRHGAPCDVRSARNHVCGSCQHAMFIVGDAANDGSGGDEEDTFGR